MKPNTPSKDIPPKKILVVEDDNSVRSFIVFSLKNAGFDVLEATSAEEAFKKLAMTKPHIILLDIMLPRMDGFTFCVELKKKYAASSPPVIFVTAYGKDDLIEKAKQAGAQGLIEKPVMFDELYRQVLEGLDGHFTMPTRLKYGKHDN